MIPCVEEALCTGCGICSLMCPIGCIQLQQNSEGFLYPHISNACIDCGKCRKVCPQINTNICKNNHNELKVFAAKTISNDVWQSSSSGGAFTEICRAWARQNATDGYYTGADWDGFNVIHKIVRGVNAVTPFCKSKYIASDAHNCFPAIKELLNQGEFVLFSGTPCQVSGLRSYLEKDYENLICIDIICHGVGSPAVFKAYIEILQEYFNDDIASYQFRYKSKYYDMDHLERIQFKSGRSAVISTDPYMRIFTSQLCLRKSCGSKCLYRSRCRIGDITIGDFKAFSKVFPDKKRSRRNYSTLIINSEKGSILLEWLKKEMELLPCRIEDVEQYNRLFSDQTKDNPDREAFFTDFVATPVEAINKWGDEITIYQKTMKKKILELLPDWVVSRL